MEEHNIFIIILIIILLFFLSADKNITSDSLDHNTIPLLLVLIIFYFCINDISMGILLISILFMILSTTNIKNIIMERFDHYSKNTNFKDSIEKFGLMMTTKDDIIKDINKRKKREEEKEQLQREEEQKLKDKKADKSKNLLYKNNEFDSVSYTDFKKEVGEFNNVNEISSDEFKTEAPVINIPVPLTVDGDIPLENKHRLDSLMNKLDSDVNNIS